MRRLLLLLAAAAVAGPLRADDPPKPADAPKPAAPADPGPAEFEAKFADDSTLKVVLLDPVVTITTKYGKLTLPVTEIKRVEFGFRYPPGVEAKVEAAAADLGAAAFRTREEAEKTLVGFAEYAAPAVRRAKKSGDPETAKRAEAVWKKLADKLPPEKLEVKDFDLVEAEFPVRGRIDPAALKVKSKYFGDAELKLAEIRGMRSMAAPAGPSAFDLDATKHARQGWPAWMDTGVDVTPDGPLELTVTGQIDQNPGQPGQYISTPIGNGNQAPGLPGGRAVMPVGGNPAMAGGGFPNRGWVMSGTVIGKIGTDGQPFLVGAGFKQTKAVANGRLFLIIAPSNWGVDSSGNYQVKVKTGG